MYGGNRPPVTKLTFRFSDPCSLSAVGLITTRALPLFFRAELQEHVVAQPFLVREHMFLRLPRFRSLCFFFFRARGDSSKNEWAENGARVLYPKVLLHVSFLDRSIKIEKGRNTLLLIKYA